MNQRSYFDNIQSASQLNYKLKQLASKEVVHRDRFIQIASMTPPPRTIAYSSHIFMLYIGKHKGKISPFCQSSSCWRDSQKQLKQMVYRVKNEVGSPNIGQGIIKELYTMNVSDDTLKLVGQTIRSNNYLSEASIKNHSVASYVILLAIMARVKLKQIQDTQIQIMNENQN